MELVLEDRKVFAYTAAHELDPAKPTLAFVHGAGLDHSAFGLQSRYFGYHGWNVLALDLPGHGRSAGPALATVPEMARWVFKVLDRLSFQRVSIVGHSMGALVALEAAAREAARIERVALLGVAYPMRVSDEFLDAARRNDPAAYDMETIWGHAPRVPLGGSPNPGMWMYGDMLARLRRLAPGVLHTDLLACHTYELSGEVRCPVLYVLGQRDQMAPPRSARALLERLKGEVTLIEVSGHTLMAEAPDATLDALIGFFSATSAPATPPSR